MKRAAQTKMLNAVVVVVFMMFPFMWFTHFAAKERISGIKKPFLLIILFNFLDLLHSGKEQGMLFRSLRRVKKCVETKGM